MNQNTISREGEKDVVLENDEVVIKFDMEKEKQKIQKSKIVSRSKRLNLDL